MKGEFPVFLATTATLTLLISIVALDLWQTVDAVYVVWVGMGAVTVLAVATCEIQNVPLVDE